MSVCICVSLPALWNVYPVKSLLYLSLWGEAYSSGVANSYLYLDLDLFLKL